MASCRLINVGKFEQSYLDPFRGAVIRAWNRAEELDYSYNKAIIFVQKFVPISREDISTIIEDYLHA